MKNKENEVLLTLFKKEDKIVSIVYEAEYEYFDILLDSAKEIIYNVDLVNKEYELSYNVSELELEDLTLTGNKSVKTKGTTTWKIANNHKNPCISRFLTVFCYFVSSFIAFLYITH